MAMNQIKLSERNASRLIVGDLSVDTKAHLVRAKGVIVALGPSEFALLVYLMKNRGQVCSRSELMTAIGKNRGDIKDRTIDIWIGTMRRSMKSILHKDVIRTVRYLGYIID